MTEHAAVIFVFFFLAEYGSIVLICILSSILFIGGYVLNLPILVDIVEYWFNNFNYIINYMYFLPNLEYNDLIFSFNINNQELYNTIIKPFGDGIYYSLWLALKSCIMIFVFIWVRASFPRIRFDQLMSFCWTVLLPIVIAFIIIVPCIIYCLNIFPSNIIL
jgi:NADH-ubiquinone oxidoreductase chain 1